MDISDYDEVYSLWLSCKGMGLNNLDDSRHGIGTYLQRNPHTCFVAVENGKIVGVIICGHDGRRGYIYHTAVSPDCRKMGIGSALVGSALKALKAEGINKAALVVFSRNETGNSFWEKLGFTVREDLTYRNLALCDIERMDT